VLGAILAGSAGGAEAAQVASEIGQLAGAGLIAAYSRDQEREADAIGQELAAQAGYDPRAMAAFLDSLDKYTRLHSATSAGPSYFDSHPPLSERVTSTTSRAGQLATNLQPPVADRAGMLQRFDGLIVGNDPAQGVFRDNLFLHPQLDLALQFPASWKTVNERDVVAAQSPDGRALITMHLEGPARDPRVSAQEFIGAHALRVAKSGSVTIGGYRAFRISAIAATDSGDLGVLITWIEHPKGVMRIAGATPVSLFTSYVQSFGATAASFRALRNQERADITELRLRTAAARSRESLASLAQRSNDRWSLEETAIVNGLQTGAALAQGQLIKIAVEQRYQR
jgi:predicted Zn-dependent protease